MAVVDEGSLFDMLRAHAKTREGEGGGGGRSPPICEPLRNVAVLY